MMESEIEELQNLHQEYFPSSENMASGATEGDDSAADDDDGDDDENDDDNLEQHSEDVIVQQRAEMFYDNMQRGQQITFEPDSRLDSLQQMYEKGCACHMNCLEKINLSELKDHILTMRELTKEEKDMYLMGKLKVKSVGTTVSSSSKRQRYMFSFDDREVCKETFLLAHDIGEKHLKNLVKHLKENGPIPREHGNKGNKPKHSLTTNDVQRCVRFLIRYADINGLPQPAAPHGNDEDPPIYLPADTTKKDLHTLYTTASQESNERAVALSTFKTIWNSCIPHIKVASPRDDVCAKCESLRSRVITARTDEDKLVTLEDFRKHIDDGKREHQLYIQAVTEAKDEVMTFGPRPDGVIRSCSNSLSKMHYTFDFAQQLTLPHHFRQEGPLFFTMPRRVQIFGVCIEGAHRQINYVIDESQTIGPDGTNTHGPNAVLSMLHHALVNYGYGEQACVMHCDNCSGQNKNRYTLAYLSWRVMCGLHREIKLLLQIPGHTRCLVDAGFARIKKLYRRSDCDSMAQVTNIIEKSGGGNIAVAVNSESVPWYNWKEFCQTNFKPLKGIRKFHHFRFSAISPGYVFCKVKSTDEEIPFYLLKDPSTMYNAAELPRVIMPAGLSIDRKRYMYKHLRPLVKDPYKDVTCPIVDTIEE